MLNFQIGDVLEFKKYAYDDVFQLGTVVHISINECDGQVYTDILVETECGWSPEGMDLEEMMYLESGKRYWWLCDVDIEVLKIRHVASSTADKLMYRLREVEYV